MGLTQTTPTSATFGPSNQESWVTTRLDFLVNWSRSKSLWPMPFGTACCAIEFMATAATRFDLARFGMERLASSPRQADVLLCAGFSLALPIGQTLFKFAAVNNARLQGPLVVKLLTNVPLIGAFAWYGLTALFWFYILTRVPLSTSRTILRKPRAW